MESCVTRCSGLFSTKWQPWAVKNRSANERIRSASMEPPLPAPVVGEDFLAGFADALPEGRQFPSNLPVVLRLQHDLHQTLFQAVLQLEPLQNGFQFADHHFKHVDFFVEQPD